MSRPRSLNARLMAPLVRLELRRAWRDPVLLFFVVVLPLVCYLGFGAVLPLDSLPGVDGGLLNTSLMVGLAGYGAATAAATITGQAAVERLQGWGRQLALTPAGDTGYATAKAVVASVVACLPIGLTFAAGAATGVRLPWWGWCGSALVLATGSAMWAGYGLAVGLTGRSQSSLAIASGGLVLFSFMGGVYLPLTGQLLSLGRWTPLYGYVTLARWPATGGQSPLLGEPSDQLGMAVMNCLLWTMAFVAVAGRQVSASRAR